MKGTLGKLAPTSAVLLLVALCCWPASEILPASGDKAAELSPAMLRPALATTPTRDPFEDTVNKEPRRRQPALATRPEQIAAKEASRGQTVRKAVAARWRLNGTCLGGNSPLAIIDGELYAVGDRLKTAKPSSQGKTPTTTPAEPVVFVVRILADRVILRVDQETVELTFPDRDSPRPASSSASKPAAKPPVKSQEAARPKLK